MATSMWIKKAWLPWSIHAYTVYTSIGGKGWCQARKSAGKKSTLDLKHHEEGHMKSRIGAIGGSTKWALVQQKF